MTILELLEAHKLGWVADDAGHYKCSCGFYPDPFDGTDATSDDHHRAHVAEVLEAHQREREAEAWGKGVTTALNHAILNPDGITLRLEHLDGRPWENPYRAEQVRATP